LIFGDKKMKEKKGNEAGKKTKKGNEIYFIQEWG
jgi:hypothetical protein